MPEANAIRNQSKIPQRLKNIAQGTVSINTQSFLKKNTFYQKKTKNKKTLSRMQHRRAVYR